MPFSDSEISIMDKMAREAFGSIFHPRGDEYLDREKISRVHPPIKEKEMNVQEKSFIKSFMEITHGPGASKDDLIIASGYFHAVEEQILKRGHKVPEKFQESIRAVDRDLDTKVLEEETRELKRLEDLYSSLLPNEEKLSQTKIRIEELKKKLNK